MMNDTRRFWSIILAPILVLGTLASVSSTSDGYSLAHRGAAFVQANAVAALRPEIGGRGFMDRVRAIRDVGLRYGLDDQWHVTHINDRRYQIVHPASITYGSRSWHPGASMQPPDGHSHDELQHSDTLDGGYRIDPEYLGIGSNDTTLYPGARGFGASAGTGGRCVRGADLKILRPQGGTQTEEENRADGTLAAAFADSTRKDSLDIIDVNDIPIDALYETGGGALTIDMDDGVGGSLSDDGSTDKSCIWAAGQTARGPGIVLTASLRAEHGLSHDVLLTGWHSYKGEGAGGSNVRIFATQHVLMMHNSLSGGSTELLNVHARCDVPLASLPTENWYQATTGYVTVQENFFFESFQTSWTHGGCKAAWLNDGTKIDDDSIPNNQELHNVDAVGNIFSGHSHRAPRGVSFPTRQYENIWFDWFQGALEWELGKVEAEAVDNRFMGFAETGTRRREVQYHFETASPGDIVFSCQAGHAGSVNNCVRPDWVHEFGVAHRLTGYDAPRPYLSGNLGRNSRQLSDDSIQFRLMSKYHGNQDDTLPENDYCPSGLDCVDYHPGDTIADNSGDTHTGLWPDSVEGVFVHLRGSRISDSPIPLDSDRTAAQLRDSLPRLVGAFYQLNADGTRRTEIDAAEDTNFVAIEDSVPHADLVGLTQTSQLCEDKRIGSCWPSRSDGTAWTDTDDDGLPDEFEAAHGADSVAMDATADPDGDGRSNYVEFIAGPDADPNVAESPSFGLATDPGGLTCTFEGGAGNCRQVVKLGVTVEQRIRSLPGGGRDTSNFIAPEWGDSIPATADACWTYKPGQDTVLVVGDSIFTASVEDSASVASILDAWGVQTTVSHLRSMSRCVPQ